MSRITAGSRHYLSRMAPGSRVALLLAVALIAGCAQLPENYEKTSSHALEDYASTMQGRNHLPLEQANPGKSGFALMRWGSNAFSTRIRAIDTAEKTIDLQVYIWQPDETGKIIAERIISAADRGVRVRLLVDDLGFGGADRAMAALDSHPNIELRVFNPFADRDNPMFDFLSDFNRVNSRMHNKIQITDNSAAIVGGRNIGDHYFAVDPGTNFRDMDIAVVGPLVRDISRVFDHFWRSDWSMPAGALVDMPGSDELRNSFVTGVRQEIAEGNYPYSVDTQLAEFDKELPPIGERYIWARGAIVWDDPTDLKEGEATAGDLVTRLRRKLATVEHSLIVESAYLVLGDRGVAEVKSMVDRGVDVRILTNSLASNDVLAAHAGHAEYREELLKNGAQIYEMRPDSNLIKKTWVGQSRAGLHTKAFVFDKESLFIGSFNLDPRSANINTEAGIYVEDKELTRQLLEYMEEGIQPDNSYRVELDDDGDMVWITETDGLEVRYDVDPLSTWGQRFMSDIIEMLPVESQL